MSFYAVISMSTKKKEVFSNSLNESFSLKIAKVLILRVRVYDTIVVMLILTQMYSLLGKKYVSFCLTCLRKAFQQTRNVCQ